MSSLAVKLMNLEIEHLTGARISYQKYITEWMNTTGLGIEFGEISCQPIRNRQGKSRQSIMQKTNTCLPTVVWVHEFNALRLIVSLGSLSVVHSYTQSWPKVGWWPHCNTHCYQTIRCTPRGNTSTSWAKTSPSSHWIDSLHHSQSWATKRIFTFELMTTPAELPHN